MVAKKGVEQQAYTPQQVAEIFGVSLSYVRKQIKEGAWPTISLEGNVVRIPKSFVDQKLGEAKEG